MAEKKYKVASEEGAALAQRKVGDPAIAVGDVVGLDLTDHEGQELSVLAAGWLEPVKKKEK